MQSLLASWLALGGVAALIAAIVNILKVVGVVHDGQSDRWSAGLNLIGMALMLVSGVFAPDFSWAGLDAQAAAAASLLTVLLSYVAQLKISKEAHRVLRGLPLIGKTFPIRIFGRELRSRDPLGDIETKQ